MKRNNNDSVVSVDLRLLKEGTCLARDFGKGDRRVICREQGKLKIFELTGTDYA